MDKEIEIKLKHKFEELRENENNIDTVRQVNEKE